MLCMKNNIFADNKFAFKFQPSTKQSVGKQNNHETLNQIMLSDKTTSETSCYITHCYIPNVSLQ